ncbi:hypothetical protein LZ30DRAFT_26165 [Colletotrichum cereale]|nr:hypothetical protein LZ30DRAFT_26165 [Colletotrichum cereale]
MGPCDRNKKSDRRSLNQEPDMLISALSHPMCPSLVSPILLWASSGACFGGEAQAPCTQHLRLLSHHGDSPCTLSSSQTFSRADGRIISLILPSLPTKLRTYVGHPSPYLGITLSFFLRSSSVVSDLHPVLLPPFFFALETTVHETTKTNTRVPVLSGPMLPPSLSLTPPRPVLPSPRLGAKILLAGSRSPPRPTREHAAEVSPCKPAKALP